jgi:hypothetical protein
MLYREKSGTNSIVALFGVSDKFPYHSLTDPARLIVQVQR